MALKTMVDNATETIKMPLYLITVGLVYIGYIAVFLGISYISPSYIRILSNIAYILVGLMLAYKFNPLRSASTITEADSKLIFVSAVFIIFNLGITEYALMFFDTVKTTFNI
jgi:hypothetical protein